MTAFELSRDQLIELVAAAETRNFAEEVELLEERGTSLHWMLQALSTHEKKGISNDKASLEQRVNAFGSNDKYEPPMKTFCILFKEALDDFSPDFTDTRMVSNHNHHHSPVPSQHFCPTHQNRRRNLMLVNMLLIPLGLHLLLLGQTLAQNSLRHRLTLPSHGTFISCEIVPLQDYRIGWYLHALAQFYNVPN